MGAWNVDLQVWLKPSVFDPQGHAVEQALLSLGHEGVGHVRIGKAMMLCVTAESAAAVEEKVRAMCETVLSNPVMETYEIVRIEPAEAAAKAGESR
ncbi:phosphoribosylformylglycinamidine synthase subunit PurS [Alicyclobacillus cycloheptanicus]|uniref:Phosphoribosylformylglycinamidine synthase subunit PurS n=1 Tax=Alicyclobacillus cycloheptanicus TaxID=1457 RepID=A0ABT9XN83_9BACL|nr:phosphoribosylformylglycinamidine synthase subunit PurS [Alicyclobacillus cycloheptanicus]MDQ0191161.1 phosphoribosylformylglycinamidine synthase [Alicyclobacillus cycloheptanicus]WDM02009.1 phosphoribosylformylglycinamidine synthase subunit PurS [Alicyclobacillus cycloheptanicus]